MQPVRCWSASHSRNARLLADVVRARLEEVDAVDNGGGVPHDSSTRDVVEVVRHEGGVWPCAAVLRAVAAAFLVLRAAGREFEQSGSAGAKAAKDLDDEVVLILGDEIERVLCRVNETRWDTLWTEIG